MGSKHANILILNSHSHSNNDNMTLNYVDIVLSLLHHLMSSVWLCWTRMSFWCHQTVSFPLQHVSVQQTYHTPKDTKQNHSNSGSIFRCYCWWLRNFAPVEVGSLSYHLQGFIHPIGGCFSDFWTINSMIVLSGNPVSLARLHHIQVFRRLKNAHQTSKANHSQKGGTSFWSWGVPTVFSESIVGSLSAQRKIPNQTNIHQLITHRSSSSLSFSASASSRIITIIITEAEHSFPPIHQ